MGSGAGARGSDVTTRPRAPGSTSPAGAQVRSEAERPHRAAGRRQGWPHGQKGAGAGPGAAGLRGRRCAVGYRVWIPRGDWSARLEVGPPCAGLSAEAGGGDRPAKRRELPSEGRSARVARIHSLLHDPLFPALGRGAAGESRSLPTLIALHPSLRSESSLPDGEFNRKGREMRWPAAISSPGVSGTPRCCRTT